MDAVPYDPELSEAQNLTRQRCRNQSLADASWRQHRSALLAQFPQSTCTSHDPHKAVCIGQAAVPGLIGALHTPTVPALPATTDTISHVTRNIHGLRQNLNTPIRNKETYYSIQETDVNECHVNALRQQASAAGYSLRLGNSVPLGKDAKGTWGWRTAFLLSTRFKDISKTNDPYVTLLLESGR